MACEYYKSIILNHIPEGWKAERTLMSPFYGYVWIHNNKSRFSKDGGYRHALVPRELLEEGDRR